MTTQIFRYARSRPILQDSHLVDTAVVPFNIRFGDGGWIGAWDADKEVAHFLNNGDDGNRVYGVQIPWPGEMWVRDFEDVVFRVGVELMLRPNFIIPSVQVLRIIPGKNAWIIGVLTVTHPSAQKAEP